MAENKGITETAPAKAGAKVTVACKLPTGLVLHLDEMVERKEVRPGGYDVVKVARTITDDEGNLVLVRLNGSAVPRDGASWTIIGGYGLTENVDKDFWDRWLEANKNTPLVKKQLVYAYEKPAMATDAAKERSGVRSGLEPIDPSGDPRRELAISEEEESAKRRKAKAA